MQYKGYTIEIVGKTENGRAYLIDVKATKGAEIKERQFDGIVSIDGLKSAVKSWIDNDELKTTLPSNGTIDFSDTTVPPTPPTQAELDKAEWEADFARLEKVKRLIDCQVLTGTEPQIVTLRNKVKSAFKPDYLS